MMSISVLNIIEYLFIKHGLIVLQSTIQSIVKLDFTIRIENYSFGEIFISFIISLKFVYILE